MLGDANARARVLEERTLAAGSSELAAHIRGRIDEARAATATAERFVLLTVPRPCAEVAGVAAAEERVAFLNRLLAEYASEHAAEVELADLGGSVLCPDGRPGTDAEGAPYIDERGFLTTAGGRAAWTWLAELVTGNES